MTLRTAARLTILVAVFVVGGGGPAAADDAAPTTSRAERAAGRFRAALHAGDEAAMNAAATDTGVGPHAVAEVLLAEHARALLAEPPRPSDFLDAAAAFAERVATRAPTRGLGAVVASWRRLDREQLALNLRLRSVWQTLPPESAAGGAEAVVQRVRDAEPDLARARGLIVPVHLRRLQATALQAASRTDEAIAAWREAADLAEAVRWPNQRSFLLRHIGFAEVKRGRHAAAVGPYAEALELLESFGDAASAKALAQTRSELCVCLAEVGRPADALPIAEQALRDLTALGDSRGVARVLVQLGLIRKNLSRPREALDAFARATAAYETLGERGGATHARLQTAITHERLGEHDIARAAFQRVEADADALGLDALSEEAALGLGRALREAGKKEEAAAAHRRVVERAAKAGRKKEEANAWKEVAVDLARAGDSPGSLEAQERRIALLEALGRREDEMPSAYRDLAVSHAAVGEQRQAIAAARKSVSGRRAQSRRHGEEFGAQNLIELRLSADIGGQAALALWYQDTNARAEAVEHAFFFAEASRAALLAESLSTRTSPTEPPEVPPARTRVEAARRRVLLTAYGGDPDPEALADARREHDLAREALRELLARADLERRRLAPPPPAEPISLDQAQAAVPEGALLVVYQQTVTQSWAIAISRDRRELLWLGDARHYAQAAAGWGAALTAPDGVEGDHPETLYDKLLAPLEPLLPEGGTLLLSPDGPLTFLPFEALVRNREGVRRRAIERWTISYVPSATVHAAIERERRAGRAGDSLVALGDPVYPTEASRADPDRAVARLRGLTSLERLPGSGDEVREVAAFFPAGRRTVLVRTEATRARLLDALAVARGRLRALHLACHGYADPADASQAGLVLADADVLTVADVARMRVPADLVVLSACESGRGVLRRGEGILGFARAFLAAGASRVLVADRRVDDEDARVLVRDFYRRHLVDGLSPAAALRAAKLARLAAGGPAAHPYAWSALVLWE